MDAETVLMAVTRDLVAYFEAVIKIMEDVLSSALMFQKVCVSGDICFEFTVKVTQ